MKRLILLSIIAILASCGKQEPNITEIAPIDTQVGDDADELMLTKETGRSDSQSFVEQGRKAAGEILQQALQHARSQKSADTFGQMAQAIQNTKIKTPAPGHDFKACSQVDGTLAFVMPKHRSLIHLCRRAEKYDLPGLAQILIHETAHVIGIDDECNATKTEVGAMRGSGEGLAFRNGYMNHCKIR